MIIRVFDKAIRELYRLFHPCLWGKSTQINGIPRIYGIKKLKLGKNVSINAGCVLQCYADVEIGDNVTISDGAKILTRELNIKEYKKNAKQIRRDHVDDAVSIGEGTWIAANVIVLPGVHISPNCVIAAGAVVAKDLTIENSLYGGIPAKMIKKL